MRVLPLRIPLGGHVGILKTLRKTPYAQTLR